MNMAPIALHGLPKRLVDDHLIEAQDLEAATSSAKTAKISLVQYLCEKKLVSDRAIGNSAAKEFGIPIYALEHHNPDSVPKDLIDNKLLKKHQGHASGATRQPTICRHCRPNRPPCP